MHKGCDNRSIEVLCRLFTYEHVYPSNSQNGRRKRVFKIVVNYKLGIVMHKNVTRSSATKRDSAHRRSLRRSRSFKVTDFDPIVCDTDQNKLRSYYTHIGPIMPTTAGVACLLYTLHANLCTTNTRHTLTVSNEDTLV